MPTWYVSKLTRAARDGGADAATAATSCSPAIRAIGRVRWRRWFDRLPSIRSMIASRHSGSGCHPRAGRNRCSAASSGSAKQLGLPPERRYLDWISIFQERRRGDLYREDSSPSLATDPATFVCAAWQRRQGRDAITCASLADLTTYLPCDLMTKVDIASMAHGLECRAPLLDYRLVEFAAALPVGFKYRRGRGKRYCARPLATCCPARSSRRRKMGFGVPLDYWFRSELKPLAGRPLARRRIRRATIFVPKRFKRCGTPTSSGTTTTARLWALVMLEMWLREWGTAQHTPGRSRRRRLQA